MEGLYINDTLEELSHNSSNSSLGRTPSIVPVVEWVIICTGMPLVLVAIAAVYLLVRKDHLAPVYVINLLVSDFLQLCCMAAWKADPSAYFSYFFYFYAVLSSVGFMACVAMERYLVITQPLRYRFQRSIRNSLVLCVLVWLLPLGYVLPVYFGIEFYIRETIYAVFVLTPLPLFLFFLVGTVKALSAARSVSAEEKRRIVAILVVVLLIYALLFLPSAVWAFVPQAKGTHAFHNTSVILLYCSPLADLTLYVFIRKGVVDQLLAFLCCCKMSGKQETSSVTNDNVSTSCNETL